MAAHRPMMGYSDNNFIREYFQSREMEKTEGEIEGEAEKSRGRGEDSFIIHGPHQRESSSHITVLPSLPFTRPNSLLCPTTQQPSN